MRQYYLLVYATGEVKKKPYRGPNAKTTVARTCALEFSQP